MCANVGYVFVCVYFSVSLDCVFEVEMICAIIVVVREQPFKGRNWVSPLSVLVEG